MKTLDNSNPSVKKYLTLIFEKPILNIRLHTQITKGSFEVERESNFIYKNSKNIKKKKKRTGKKINIFY